MFTVEKSSDTRITLKISGKITPAEMTQGMDDLFAHSQGFNDGQMRYEIRDFDMPSFGALAVEFKRIPQMFGLISRFSKVAVICDQAWIRKGAEIEGAIIPRIKIKGFDFDHVAAAEDWLMASE